jgi:hypothetical protein
MKKKGNMKIILKKGGAAGAFDATAPHLPLSWLKHIVWLRTKLSAASTAENTYADA